MITVRVANSGNPVAEMSFPAGTTLEIALTEAGADASRVNAYVNGVKQETSYALQPNDEIVAAPKIKGG